jgi:hypothetical protein
MPVVCEPTPAVMDGRYEGVVEVYTFQADGADWPVCSYVDGSETGWAVLDVKTSPVIEVSIAFPGLVGPPGQIGIDFTGQEWWPASDTRFELWWFCGMADLYANMETAVLEMYPGPGSVSLEVQCSASFLDSCTFPYNRLTTYSMVLERVCIANDTICAGDSLVTCDENATVVSTTPCGAPCDAF